jgi:tRNA-dihydrouridine synthase 1
MKKEQKMPKRLVSECTKLESKRIRHEKSCTPPFPNHRFILAPMVGASETAFRILCRNYGAELAYSPMHPADQMNDELFRAEHFPNIDADKPVVCHVSCNDPSAFAAAARHAALAGCAALDLNLGCPQRTAFVGKFGSYLMDDQDLICSMIQAAADTRAIPVTCKIRLLETKESTLRFCRRVCESGIHGIAIHGRHRAGWERTGPGARDGPAFMDQIEYVANELRTDYPEVKIFANGNTITWEDVQSNLDVTKANGLMSAEGILDNPALFLKRYGADRDHKVTFWILPPKIQKALGKLWRLAGDATTEEAKVKKKLQKYMHKLDPLISSAPNLELSAATLGDLLDKDALAIAREYVDLATAFRVSIRTAIFHTRRILKDELTRLQLMQDCLNCQSLHDIRVILTQLDRYQKDPSSFMFDQAKAQADKEALDRKHREDGKRKEYEQRMIRKAKREGKPRDYYVNQGTEVPTKATIKMLQSMDRTVAIGKWNEKHKQHCISFHLDGQCQRGRACAFLHVDVGSFVERDAVSG